MNRVGESSFCCIERNAKLALKLQLKGRRMSIVTLMDEMHHVVMEKSKIDVQEKSDQFAVSGFFGP